jgi:membrane-associated PAP2 superfamily phosphatase
MSPAGLASVIWITLMTWLPVIALFYLPNNVFGIIIKIIASIWLISGLLQITFGKTVETIGSANAGFVLNTLWFIILNFNPPIWVKYILIILIITGMGTCYKIIKEREATNPEIFL